MSKALLQFLILAVVFLGTWFGFSSINYVKRLHLDGLSKKTEKKIGDMVMEGIRKTNHEIEADKVTHVMDEIKSRLCTANAIDPEDIHLHLIVSSDINAFALPGNHIVVYTGLINQCDSVSELCGVLSHEMGHLQLNHVTKRMLNEFGIGVLATVAGNGNSRIIAQIIKTLSSTAFERKQESEADAKGVQFLQRAHINPKGFSDFMLKLSDMKLGIPSQLEWLSTHPDSKKRAETILSLIDAKNADYSPVLDDDSWEVLKRAAEKNY